MKLIVVLVMAFCSNVYGAKEHIKNESPYKSSKANKADHIKNESPYRAKLVMEHIKNETPYRAEIAKKYGCTDGDYNCIREKVQILESSKVIKGNNIVE